MCKLLVRGVRVGEWIQVWNFNVFITRRCWGGRSAPCAVDRWFGDCRDGVENIFFFFALKKTGVSCWLGRLIWDFCVDVITLG